MPILLSLLACEKVIFEQETNSVSIISLLHDFYVPVIRSVQIPPKTLAPFNWTVFVLWYRAPIDAGVWYEEMAELVGEDGESLMQSGGTQFMMEKPMMRGVHRFSNFPVYRPADCSIKLYLRNLGASPVTPPPPPPSSRLSSLPKWHEVGTYPIRIHHTYYPS
jgi:hypothetical protein